MKKLWITLPAFAPDYSGVCSALYELGGISVIHDASGCTGNYTGYDEPRWYEGESRVFCSGLRDIDAVLGRDDKLIEETLQAARDLSPTMLAVMGSPVPMVIGSDMDGIAHELEERSGLPAFGFHTNGLSLYNRGVSEAMMRVVERFAQKTEQRDALGINILGMTPLDFGIRGNAEALSCLLEQEGFHIYGKLMMGVSLEQLRDVTKASVNLVVAESGLDTAKYMWTRWRIPYVAALPLADGKYTISLLHQTLQDGQNRVLCDEAGEGDILIVAEQVLGNALRQLIRARCPSRRVTVATMFGLRKELAATGDLDLPDEESLRHTLESGRFRTLVGDPLFAQLIVPDVPVEFVPLPHPAISSKIYWDEFPDFLGVAMEQKVKQICEMQ